MLKTFLGGVHPQSRKSQTSDLNIEIMPTPDMVYVPLSQHLGAPAAAAVKNGDEVIIGQLLGKASSQISCNVYSPCCGKVRGIERRATAGGVCDHIIIQNNHKKNHAHLPPLTNPSPQEIVQRVFDCGVAGMGGAGFPTSVKLSPNVPMKYLLINAAECEPYITCDHRIMREYTEKFVTGAMLMQTALCAEQLIIGIEDNKPDAIAAVSEYVTANALQNVSVVPLATKYPQGSEKHLIYALTKIKIAKGVRSFSKGVLATNVHTALSVYLAVKEGRQCYSRVLTVTGGAINNPKNIWVPTGATFKDVIDFCGGIRQDNPPVKIISGGPMMGKAVYTTEVSVTKTTSCVLLMTKDEAPPEKQSPCINCGKCATVCPMKIMPMNIDAYSQAGLYAETEKWGIDYCIECGCCSYICPAKRQLVQSITLAKAQLRERK